MSLWWLKSSTVPSRRYPLSFFQQQGAGPALNQQRHINTGFPLSLLFSEFDVVLASSAMSTKAGSLSEVWIFCRINALQTHRTIIILCFFASLNQSRHSHSIKMHCNLIIYSIWNETCVHPAQKIAAIFCYWGAGLFPKNFFSENLLGI
jgi:hypothetical protein